MIKNHRSLLHRRCHEALHRRRVHSIPCPQPGTTIRYGLPQAGRVSLKIYNLLGEEVATLMHDENQATGYHAAIWNGRDNDNRIVASGIYVYRMSAGSFNAVKKLTMIK